MKALLKIAITLHLSLLALQAAGKPNFLFIIVDDQSPFDLKAYDPKSILDTPNIDRIANEGLVLDGAHQQGSWSGAVCTCSRTMIMTGRTLWHIPRGSRKKGKGQDNKAQDFVPEGIEGSTFPVVFNNAGYETVRTCKQGNSYEAANKQFQIRHDATKRGGTAESGSEWHGDQVMNYLSDREKQESKKPFLIYYGFSHPHDVRDGTPELLAKYGAVNHKDKTTLPVANPKQPPLPANWLEKHPFSNSHSNVRDEVAVSGVWNKRDERTIRNELGREFACSENIDIQIGRVLAKLEASGELGNTYVIYTSDHGMAIGRHGLQGKQNLYEHTFRVPYIVMGPGVRKGRAAGNIYLLDTLATLCDLAGIPVPETNEGKSFKSVLTGEKQAVRDTLYGAYAGGAKPGMRCVKKGDWKLIKYDDATESVHETQLFNLAENPDEFLTEHHKDNPMLTDLAENPEHAAKLAEMEALLKSEMGRLNDPYPLWDQKK
jgi:choline-sulfatase